MFHTILCSQDLHAKDFVLLQDLHYSVDCAFVDLVVKLPDPLLQLLRRMLTGKASQTSGVAWNLADMRGALKHNLLVELLLDQT